MEEKTFKQKYIEGGCEFSAIDNYIEAWHGNMGGENLRLFEYLGFTDEEYSFFLKTPSEFETYLNQLVVHQDLQEVDSASIGAPEHGGKDRVDAPSL